MHKNNSYTEQNISCPIERLGGIWRFERSTGSAALSRSTSGHLIHFIKSGQGELNIGKRDYIIGSGSIIYYYGAETVKSHFIADTIFYSVAFLSQQFSPLPLDCRLLTANKIISRLVEQLYAVYQTTNNSNNYCYCFELLLRLINEINSLPQLQRNITLKKTHLWDKITTWLRLEHCYRPSLEEICDKFQISRSTIIRICRNATGSTPIRYFQKIRMNEAKSLLAFSGLNVSDTATYLGYPRIHEFSREFSQYFGYPPSSITPKISN